MCSVYFHASCAQAAALLCEPRFVEEAAPGTALPDPIHTEKALKRNRKSLPHASSAQTLSR
jgi:hypothetical protein